jgi:hypothetical protein
MNEPESSGGRLGTIVPARIEGAIFQEDTKD